MRERECVLERESERVCVLERKRGREREREVLNDGCFRRHRPSLSQRIRIWEKNLLSENLSPLKNLNKKCF